jgi:hypothetical protein
MGEGYLRVGGIGVMEGLGKRGSAADDGMLGKRAKLLNFRGFLEENKERILPRFADTDFPIVYNDPEYSSYTDESVVYSPVPPLIDEIRDHEGYDSDVIDSVFTAWFELLINHDERMHFYSVMDVYFDLRLELYESTVDELIFNYLISGKCEEGKNIFLQNELESKEKAFAMLYVCQDLLMFNLSIQIERFDSINIEEFQISRELAEQRKTVVKNHFKELFETELKIEGITEQNFDKLLETTLGALERKLIANSDNEEFTQRCIQEFKKIYTGYESHHHSITSKSLNRIFCDLKLVTGDKFLVALLDLIPSDKQKTFTTDIEAHIDTIKNDPTKKHFRTLLTTIVNHTLKFYRTEIFENVLKYIYNRETDFGNAKIDAARVTLSRVYSFIHTTKRAKYCESIFEKCGFEVAIAPPNNQPFFSHMLETLDSIADRLHFICLISQ